MKIKFTVTALAIGAFILTSCGGSGNKEATAPESICKDSSCITEPMSFESKAANNPKVRISFKDCKFDSIHWEKGGMGVIKDIIFSDFIENDIRPSKSMLSCDIIESKSAWIKFNDCTTGRGYVIKLPFDKTGTTSKYKSALNGFDPKFKIADGLVAYYDNTFIYVQDMATEKTAKTLMTDTGITEIIDYNDVHSLIDNVNITKDHITAKILFGGKEFNVDKPLEFK